MDEMSKSREAIAEADKFARELRGVKPQEVKLDYDPEAVAREVYDRYATHINDPTMGMLAREDGFDFSSFWEKLGKDLTDQGKADGAVGEVVAMLSRLEYEDMVKCAVCGANAIEYGQAMVRAREKGNVIWRSVCLRIEERVKASPFWLDIREGVVRAHTRPETIAATEARREHSAISGDLDSISAKLMELIARVLK